MLFVHCHCTDHDQDVHHINVGTEYELVFRKHAIRDTRWTCYLAPDNSRHATFVAYEDATPDYNRNVFWAVKEDGVYFRNPGGHDVLDYKWENGR
ncbi:S-protein homolog 9 [Linum grandiflorum]